MFNEIPGNAILPERLIVLNSKPGFGLLFTHQNGLLSVIEESQHLSNLYMTVNSFKIRVDHKNNEIISERR